MARRRVWVAPVVLWLLVAAVAAATYAVRVPLAAALDTDPRLGSGRLERPEVAPEPTPVLPALPDAGPVDAAALAAKLDAVPRAGVGDVVALVSDARSGTELYRRGSGARTPASSLKVLTAVVALDVLGPDRRFATTALRAPDGTLVLRGGGDPLLASNRATGYPEVASLQDLAAATASALTGSGVTRVTLTWDASLFGGPAWNPAWPETFRQSVAPVTALTADHARPNPATFVRHADPSRFAAERFAALLSTHGVGVTLRGAAATPAGSVELARVESPPVATVVEQLLLQSDNDAAEALARHVAVARGRAATPTDSAAVLADELRARGLWADSMAVRDGNGISADNRVTADALVAAVRSGIDQPRLRAVVTGLPVAGVSGTLEDRFTVTDALAARGVVRAKTGTIRGVNSLAGYVVTADGQPLVFAFLVTGGAGQTAARAWLDQVTATLASCGC